MPSATASQTIGPFWHLIEHPEWADLTRFGVAGERITLSGSVVDASGKPLANAQVIVFAADRAYWTPQSRRIAATQASASGRYGFRNLPAGEYLIAIAVDADDGQWFDPAFLESSSGEALTITLTAGAPVIQDLRGR